MLMQTVDQLTQVEEFHDGVFGRHILVSPTDSGKNQSGLNDYWNRKHF